MDLILALAAIAVTVIVVARLCEPLGLPAPIVLLGVGVAASFLPFVPQVSLSPEVVLVGLLPPLLYAAAIGTSLTDITTNRLPILGLSVGLVLFTALGVGLVAWWLLPIPFAIAFALGAVVAPPDAVAATAIARRIGLPRRVTTILEGESLLNDATALVALRTAVAAGGLVMATHGEAGGHAEEVTTASVAGDFLLAAVGGLLIGIAAYLVVGLVRRKLVDSAADTALSFVAPYVAFVPAEQVGSSGVIAVVTAGLLLAHRAPVIQTAQSRLSERINWSSITFLLENAVFLLIGLQAWLILHDLGEGDISTGRTFAVGVAVLVTCMLLRPVWILPFTWLRDRAGHDVGDDWLKNATISSWAGMRGVVTLAAALTLPHETPGRPALVMIALIVTIGTLLIQTTTLPMLARALGIRGPDPREDALQEATVVQAATAAGLRAIEGDPNTAVVDLLRDESTSRVNRIWERLGTLTGSAETPTEAYRRLRVEMITAEREKLLKIRDNGHVDHAVLSSVLYGLDAEESALGYGVARNERLRESPLLPPEQVAGACVHLTEEPAAAVPGSAEGCEDCLAEGRTDWVHLRLCTHCGHVGCCDSSPRKHAAAHFGLSTHPVMRSLEPGEAWRWCFVDEVLG